MATNLPPSLPAPLPGTTRLPDTRLPNERTRDTEKPGSKDSQKADAANTGVFPRLPNALDSDGSTGGDASQGGGGGQSNTAIAQAISNLSNTGIQRVAENVSETLAGKQPQVRQLPQIGGELQTNLAGVSTYATGNDERLARERFVQTFGSTQGQTITNLAPPTNDVQAQILAARTEARLNSGGPNPLIVARDGALGNG